MSQPPLASDVVTPLKDAIWANAELQWMDWSTTLIGQAKQIDEAQNGKGRFSGRGPTRRATPTSPLLTREQAQEQVTRAGVDVPVSEGMRQEALDLKIKWEKRKQELESTVARADQGFGTQFALGATAFVVGAADPVNVATTFVPVIGEAKLAYWLAKGAARFGPTAAKLAVRAGVGAYDAGIGSIASEPVIYAAHQAVGDDYDLVDSVINVGLGAGAGSALRVLGGAGVDLYHGMRVRGYLSIDAYGRVINEGLRQLGFGRRIDVAPMLAAEHGAVVLPSTLENAAAEAIAPLPKLRRNSVLVMPARGAAGNLAVDRDLFSAQDVFSEYLPVPLSAAGGQLPSSGSEVYRIVQDGEVVVYTRTPDSKKDRDVFTVHRLRPGDADYGAPLSVKRLEGDTSPRDGWVLFMRPSADLERAITKGKQAKLDELHPLDAEELLKFYPAEADRGHRLDAELGDAAHVAVGEYADASKDLQRGWNQDGKIPDVADSSGGLIDAKPETDSGISAGRSDAKYYEQHLNRKTSILLHSNFPLQESMSALNKRIREAWDAYDPNWRYHLTKAGREEADELRKSGAIIPPLKRRPKQETKVQKGNAEEKKQP